MAESEQKNKPSQKLAEIFSKISMSELPAMSVNVQELISLTCSSRSAGSELSKVILKDYSLTNKVLQVVNSAYYSTGRPVSSISRAVTLLGFDAVRDMATGIALFEEFVQAGLDKESITKLLTRSFLSAIQARDMVTEKNLKVAPEEAFICTLLHNLGKIVICIYLPDKYREIETKIKNGMSEERASRAVLSELSYLDIGEEVAKFWNISEKVISSMGANPTKPKSKSDVDGYLHNVACFSNSLVEKICDGANLAPLIDKYGKMFSVDPEELVKNIQDCIAESEDISNSVRYGLNKLKIRSRVRTVSRNLDQGVFSSRKLGEPREEPIEPIEEKQNDIPVVMDTKEGDKGDREEISIIKSDASILDEVTSGPTKSVNDFIREITEILMGSFSLNNFYLHILQGLFVGVGFDRVILSIVSVQPSKIALVGRFGLGDIEMAAVKKFEHVLAAGPYAISNSLRLGKDMMLSGDAQIDAFPSDLHYLVRGRNVYLFPICVDNKGIGLIYLDRKVGRPLVTRTDIKNVRLFRDFAVLAIKKIRYQK